EKDSIREHHVSSASERSSPLVFSSAALQRYEQSNLEGSNACPAEFKPTLRPTRCSLTANGSTANRPRPFLSTTPRRKKLSPTFPTLAQTTSTKPWPPRKLHLKKARGRALPRKSADASFSVSLKNFAPIKPRWPNSNAATPASRSSKPNTTSAM